MEHISTITETKGYIDLIADLHKRAKNNQLKFIEKLNEHNFKMVPAYVIAKLYPDIGIQKEHKDYQFMLRSLLDGSWDENIAIGVKYFKQDEDEFIVYLYGRYLSTYELEWPTKKVNFNKRKTKRVFPDGMTYDERAHWRNEHDKVERRTKSTPSSFYLKWAQKIYDMNKENFPNWFKNGKKYINP